MPKIEVGVVKIGQLSKNEANMPQIKKIAKVLRNRL